MPLLNYVYYDLFLYVNTKIYLKKKVNYMILFRSLIYYLLTYIFL